MDINTFDVKKMQEVFCLPGSYQMSYQCNEGHINQTYTLVFRQKDGKDVQFVIQKINTNVFRNPEQLMENVVGVTQYLREIVQKQGGDPQRETMTVFHTQDGLPYYKDEEGQYWRCYNFITDTYTCQAIENPQTFYNAAKAFGNFQCLLANYPSHTLHETIANFHNTPSRLRDLEDSIAADTAGRKSEAQGEIAFALARREDTARLLNLLDEGNLPLRVTHNDTKLNNVLFDKESGEGICVVDLDTVMPGLSLYDFGDSIRFGANTAAEDERDLRKVSVSLELFEAYVSGYLSTAGKSLVPEEIRQLAFSGKLLSLECGMRFLTDYLNGDTYFRIAYADHNLVRCRTQFALVADMERKMDEMNAITQRVAAQLGL